MKISVVIPVYKQKAMFLENLKINLPFLTGCEVLVIDDASGESLGRDLRALKKVIYLKNSKNLGFGQTVNKAVAVSRGEFIMLLNSDVRLTDSSFKKAIGLMNHDKNLFAVSFAQRQEDGTVVGKNRIYFKAGLIHHRTAIDLDLSPNAWAEGGAAIFRTSYIKLLGGFEKLYSPFYWEDVDLSYCAYKKGWYVLFNPEILVEHKHESTIGEFYSKKEVTEIAYRNQFIFIWSNIHDRLLVILHLLSLPYIIIRHGIRADGVFFKGFWQAIARREQIMRLRRHRKKEAMVTDMKILNSFHE